MKSIQRTQSRPLTFSELAVGDRFIFFPQDGDDAGHGGYRGTHNVFVKVSGQYRADDARFLADNAMNIATGIPSAMPASMQVLRVQL